MRQGHEFEEEADLVTPLELTALLSELHEPDSWMGEEDDDHVTVSAVAEATGHSETEIQESAMHPSKTTSLIEPVSGPGYSVEPSAKGVTLLARKSWDAALLKACRTYNVDQLILNEGLGWSDDNVDFLDSLVQVKHLELYNARVTDDSPVYALKSLESINIKTGDRKPFDFERLSSLKGAFLEWQPRFSSLLEHGGIEALKLFMYRFDSFQALCKMTSLVELNLTNGPLSSMKESNAVPRLRSLSLWAAPKLRDLAGISRLKELQVLSLDEVGTLNKSFRLHNVEEISKLDRLQELTLNAGPVNSLEFLEKLQKLQILRLHSVTSSRTNVLDGDLTPIRRLPNLRYVTFANRRHYNLTIDDFQMMNDQYRREIGLL